MGRAPVTNSSSVQTTSGDQGVSTRTLLNQAYTAYDSLQYGVGSYVIPEEDKESMKEMSTLQGPKAWTYGEITFEGVETLGKHLRVDEVDHVFYDLGSGLGRMVFQVFFDWRVRRAVGVELSAHRHSRAARAHRHLAAPLATAAPRQCEFLNANLLTVNMADATIVYLACTCWDADFMSQVMEKLKGLPELQWVVSTESLEGEFGLEEEWCQPHSQVKLPMSWDEDWPVYVYKPVGSRQTS